MITRKVAFTDRERAALVEVEIPDAPGPDEILLRATRTLISTGTELVCFRGEADEGTHWATFMHWPQYPGYSAVGTVAAVGEQVEGIEVGRRVITTSNHSEFSVVKADRIWGPSVPESISDDEAVWAVLGVITQTGVRMAEHVMGDRVVVIGLGPLGQLVVQYLRAMGMREVLAVDMDQGRLDVALAHGATAGFCGSAADAKDFVLERLGGELADVVYDVTGHWSVLPQALPLARDHGKLLLLGDSPFPTRQHLTYDVVSRQVRIIGSRSSWLGPEHSMWTPQRMVDLFLTYLQRGEMRVSDLTSHTVAPRECSEVYPMLLADRTSTLAVAYDWSRVG